MVLDPVPVRLFCQPGLIDSYLEMPSSLTTALQILRKYEPELRKHGVCHASVFGSVARGEANSGSDVDILVDLDPSLPIGIFQYARLKLYIGELVGGADVVNRKTLKPLLRDAILHEAVDAF